MEISTIQHLLNTVSALSKKYDEINRLTGMNFNIFSIMGMETSEVKLHSAFIAELLSTDGSHNCGNVFAQLFIAEVSKRLGKMSVKMEEAKEAKKFIVKREEYIGPVNKDKAVGGRIDIVVFNEKRECLFIIENKINAPDGGRQLLRYNTRYPEKPIFYLSRYGKEPDDNSTKSDVHEKYLETGKDYFCISYHHDIINWLEECFKEASRYPYLRETISQYINVVKKITNQNFDSNMDNEIVKTIMGKPEYLNAGIKIARAIPLVKEIIVENIIEQIRLHFVNQTNDANIAATNEHGLLFDKEQKVKSIILYEPNWKYCIYGYFDGNSNYENFYIGIDIIDEATKRYIETIQLSQILTGLDLGKVQFNKNWAWMLPKFWNDATWNERLEMNAGQFIKLIESIHKAMNNSDISNQF